MSLDQVGQRYSGFIVTRIVNIPELQCKMRELVHEKSGAEVLHLENDDPENLFCLSFRTMPETSNGIAHILEHTTLCGSKKFPIRDPFFAMNRRSLNTFMNALTGSDFTCYPAATQVHKDFYNLLDVYLDAVFHPLLNELSFLQEGWRFEFEELKNSQSPLEYKGVVFNEMKGSLSSPTTRLMEAVNAVLYPTLTYGYNSGGDPKDIPTLTLEQLKEFHRLYYHPSRCLFFFYGNMPLEEHLDFIATRELDKVEKLPPLPPLPREKRYTQPVYQELTYPITPEEDPTGKTLIAMGWLTCHILEQLELLALCVIEIVLMDNDGSPLKMALLKSGLCTQANIYTDLEITEIPLIILLKGCSLDSGNKAEQLVKKTLIEIAKEGIPSNLIENAIHQLEFARSETGGDSGPFGLSLFMRAGLLKHHSGPPEYSLMIHSLFKELRDRFKNNPRFFEELLEKYFIKNNHFIHITFKPDSTLGAKEIQQERETLESIRNSLKEKDIEEIIEKSHKLEEIQQHQREENLDVLPKIALSDVPQLTREYPLVQEKRGNLEVFHHACFTNDIVYAELVFDLPDLPEEDLFYVRLYTTLMSQVGCGGRNYVENLEYIQGNTGGVGASLAFNIQALQQDLFSPSLHIKGKALRRKIDKLFPLFHEMATSVDFTDLSRIKEIILKHHTALESSLSSNALRYAISLSASGLNLPSKISNEWYGLSYLLQMRQLAQKFDEKAPFLIEKLNQLQNKIMCLKEPHLVISCQQDIYDTLVAEKFYGLQDIITRPFSRWEGNYPVVPPKAQGKIIASPVAFISKAFDTVPYSHPDAPALNLASFLFDNLTLHTRVREQGGAYGGGAVSNAVSGNFYFYSYRDPNVSKTLDAFKEAVNEVVEGNFDDEDLEEAKLEKVQGLDTPIPPGARAEVAYSWLRENRPIAVRQAFRDRLLKVTCQEVQEATKKWILPKLENAPTVVFAGKELLEQENTLLIQQEREPLSSIETV